MQTRSKTGNRRKLSKAIVPYVPPPTKKPRSAAQQAQTQNMKRNNKLCPQEQNIQRLQSQLSKSNASTAELQAQAQYKQCHTARFQARLTKSQNRLVEDQSRLVQSQARLTETQVSLTETQARLTETHACLTRSQARRVQSQARQAQTAEEYHQLQQRFEKLAQEQIAQRNVLEGERRAYEMASIRTRLQQQSPTGVARGIDEWQRYSTPPNAMASKTASMNLNARYGNRLTPSRLDVDSLNEHHWMWWIYLLLYLVRTMFESLTQQYRPQSVMRTLCGVFVTFAIVSWIWHGNVSVGCFVCFCMSIVCAIVGADVFYPTPSVAEYAQAAGPYDYEYDRDNNVLNVPQATPVNTRYQYSEYTTNASPWRR